MDVLSPYIIAILSAWAVAQGAKYVIGAVRTRSLSDMRQLYYSGGMPSAHSATTVALAIVIGMRVGFDSATFAIAILFAGIVMYDALMVRRSTGEQGVAIQRLIREQKSTVQLPRAAKGHEPLEVAVGAFLGASVGFIVYFVTF